MANYVLDHTGQQINTKLTKAENVDNKVTSISSSSTDTQYPSAKLLYDQLQLKAPINSPTFTGNPNAPTPFYGDNSTQIATTEYIHDLFEHDYFGYENSRSMMQDDINVQWKAYWIKKFNLTKATITSGMHSPFVIDNNGTLAFCQFDTNQQTNVLIYNDICGVIKQNNIILDIQRQSSNSNSSAKAQYTIDFTINDIAYTLLLTTYPAYGDLITNINNHFSANKLEGYYFLLYDNTNDTPVFNIPFDIDIYFLYPNNLNEYYYEKTAKIQNSIFYNFDGLKNMLNALSVDYATSFYTINNISGWYKISDAPLLYEDKNSFFVTARKSVDDDYNGPGDIDAARFIDDASDVIPILNYGFRHSNINGYDYIEFTENGIDYSPGLISNANGFYIYTPLIMLNSLINSGFIFTYETNNPSYYSNISAFTNDVGYLTQHQDISGKAPLASPALTGIPTAPTAAAGTNTTQIATTAFVNTAIDNNSINWADITDAKVYYGTCSSSASSRQKLVNCATFNKSVLENGDIFIITFQNNNREDDPYMRINQQASGRIYNQILNDNYLHAIGKFNAGTYIFLVSKNAFIMLNTNKNDDYAPKLSPYLEGTPMTSTPGDGDSSLRIANTEFITNLINNNNNLDTILSDINLT